MQNVLLILAEWDGDADIWSATSEDVPGLAIEADSIENLLNKLSSMIPELLVANKVDYPPEILYEVVARKVSTTHMPSEAQS
jgi:hypothetical protein